MTGITYPSTATNSFVYNGLGLRVNKTDSSGAFAYACDGTDPASPVLKDGAATYTPGLSERRGTTSKFQHADALGSTRGITDSSQAVTDSVLYDAFGMTVSRTGSTPTPFGFVGGSQYQTDSDSGLMLLGHRYYDASIGRFISSDPAQAGTNWYAYCENNPLERSDPTGLDVNGGGVVNHLPWPILVQSDGAKPPPAFKPVPLPGVGFISIVPPGAKLGGDGKVDVDVIYPFYASDAVIIHDSVATIGLNNANGGPGSPINIWGVGWGHGGIVDPRNPGDKGFLPNDPWWVYNNGAPMGTNPKTGKPDWTWPILNNPNQGLGDTMPGKIKRPGLLKSIKPTINWK